MAHQSLPHDIIIEILSRLPVKSLFRFRCVSKPWLSSISHRYFVKKHLNLAVENNNISIILNSSHQIHSINCHSSEFDQARKMDHPLNSPNGPIMLGSCDGLVCVSLSLCSSPVQDVICLWNPSTKEFKKLPSTRTFGPGIRSTLYGFGYDPVIDDYKVVRIVYFYGDRDKDFYSEVKVYSLGSNSWKRVVAIPYYICGVPVQGVFVNGALHWVGTRGSPYEGEDEDENEDEELIVAFDLVNGEFREVPRPHYLDGSFQINVLEGCLCALSKLHEVRFEVWVMMEYGVQDSWTKQFIFTQPDLIPSFMRLTPIMFCKTGELLLDKDGQDLLLYHPKHVKAMTLKVHGIPDWFEANIYVESLVSLKSGTYVGQGASGSVTGDKRRRVG